MVKILVNIQLQDSLQFGTEILIVSKLLLYLDTNWDQNVAMGNAKQLVELFYC